MQTNQTKRVLAVSLSSRGFGFACMEGKNRLVDYGNKTFYEQFKNAWLLAKATKIIERNAPDVLVLQDMPARDKNRPKRIRDLHCQLAALDKARKIPVVKITGTQVRLALLNNEQGTKHDLAKHLATLFPAELSIRLPPKRKAWMNEHPRMDTFDAIGMAVAYRLRAEKRLSENLCFPSQRFS